MTKSDFMIRFWGVRGSIPTPGKDTTKYGGNTPCVEVRCGDKLIILDAGSGIRELGNQLLKETPLEANILFSHLHWDHIQGFPFFAPAFMPENKLHLFAEKKLNTTFESLMSGQMMYPHFPISMKDLDAHITFNELDYGDVVNFGKVQIKTSRNNHSDGCIAFRIEYDGKSVVYATDTEHYACIDPVLAEASKDADYIIYDSTYSDDEYSGKIGTPKTGWGHSTWQEGVRLAESANIKNLILFHHDPDHTDKVLAKIEAKAKKAFKNTIAAYEGLVIYV
ncbi:MBL fold metallo-hydrolase [Thermodesulfobacteriota bacterium]